MSGGLWEPGRKVRSVGEGKSQAGTPNIRLGQKEEETEGSKERERQASQKVGEIPEISTFYDKVAVSRAIYVAG